MSKYISTIVALTLVGLSSCSTTNRTGPSTLQVEQREACSQGQKHPWCMQLAQTKPLGAAPYGLENTEPTNPEMRDDTTPYPRNPALSLGKGGIPGGIPLHFGGI
jgi:hypothetical protein